MQGNLSRRAVGNKGAFIEKYASFSLHLSYTSTEEKLLGHRGTSSDIQHIPSKGGTWVQLNHDSVASNDSIHLKNKGYHLLARIIKVKSF